MRPVCRPSSESGASGARPTRDGARARAGGRRLARDAEAAHASSRRCCSACGPPASRRGSSTCRSSEHADLVARAERQQMRTIVAPAKRGDILDRHGRVLATSVDADSIYAVPSEIADARRRCPQTLRRLRRLHRQGAAGADRAARAVARLRVRAPAGVARPGAPCRPT